MMDTATAARAVEGRMIGANVRFSRVTTDSRALREGDLYVALKGERFDGHEFVASAFDHGAVAALVAEARAAELSGTLVAVADPLAALGQLAAHWRSRFALPLTLVVGSNGKTTVKEMLAAILRAHFGVEHVLATQGNLNNAIGLPLTLLSLCGAHLAAVVELGMNHRGETGALAAIAQPTSVLVNNAQREHQEFMSSVAEVADEHADALAALRPGGCAIVNADDAFAGLWRAAAARAGVRVRTFGLDSGADVGARCTLRAEGTTLVLATPAGRTQVELAVPGRHMARNALAATAAALEVGASLDAVVTGLAAFRAVAGRLATTRGTSGALVLDDTYNANPDSMRAAMEVLANTPGTHWLAMGDMGEVGAQGPAFHREIGAYARELGIERLYATGELAREAVAEFGTGGVHLPTVEALADALRGDIRADVALLVKGSRFMRMERVVAALNGGTSVEAH